MSEENQKVEPQETKEILFGEVNLQDLPIENTPPVDGNKPPVADTPPPPEAGNKGAETADDGTPKPETPQFNLKEAFGDEFDSVDKVKEAIERSRVNAELKEAAQFLDEAKFLKEEPAYKIWLQQIREGKNPDNLLSILTTDYSQMSDLDAIVQHWVVEHGMTEQEAKIAAMSKFKIENLQDGESSEYSEAEKALAKLEMKAEAKSAKTSLVDLQGKLRMSDSQKREAEAAEQRQQTEVQRKNAWKPLIESKAADLGLSFDTPVKFGDQDVDVKFDIKMDDNQKQEYRELVTSLVHQSEGLQPTEENMASILKTAQAMYLGLNITKILQNNAKDVADKLFTHAAEKYNGIRPRQEAPPSTDKNGIQFGEFNLADVDR